MGSKSVSYYVIFALSIFLTRPIFYSCNVYEFPPNENVSKVSRILLMLYFYLFEWDLETVPGTRYGHWVRTFLLQEIQTSNSGSPMNKPFSGVYRGSASYLSAHSFADVNLTPSFWQYAIVNQATADAGLRYQATHVIPCKKNTGQPNIPLARDLTDEIYMRGQKENRGFSSLLASLKEGAFQFCPA